jgi:hypothetical protein
MSEIEFEIKDSREVWWATTKQYEVSVDGVDYSFRVAETPKSCEFYVLTESGWEDIDYDNLIHEAFHEQWSEGTLD